MCTKTKINTIIIAEHDIVCMNENELLAQYVAEKHDVSMERVLSCIDDEFTVDHWLEYPFIDSISYLNYDSTSVVGELDDEFIQREMDFKQLAQTYHNRSVYDTGGYLELLPITEEKEWDLKSNSNSLWYTNDQYSEVVSEFSVFIRWLDGHIWDQSIPGERKQSYALNLAMMKYGLDKTHEAETQRISVDFWNSYHTFRSHPHKNGFIIEDSEDLYRRSLGNRLNGIFDVDSEDVACEELHAYFSGSIAELVDTVRDCLSRT